MIVFKEKHTTHIVKWEYPSGLGVEENLSLMSRKRRTRRVTHTIRGCQLAGASLVAQMESVCNADLASIPGLGRSPEEGSGYPFQFSCLENLTNRGAWWDTVHGVTKSFT